MIRFDSILVRLKVRAIDEHREIAMLRFDSILVRLKAGCRSGKMTDMAKFRFHTGSIKRIVFSASSPGRGEVSIPYWFD